jgi:hypothetical protein
MWRSVERTVRDVLLPAISEEWARVIAVQLVGMATYAAQRGADPLPGRVAELRARLDELSGNPLVAAHWPADGDDDAHVIRATAAVLAAAVSDEGVAGDQVRTQLRPTVSRHLDDDLAVTGMLMPYFRGQLPDA